MGGHHQDRLTQPMIKRDGEWETASWSDAFDLITERLTAIKDEHGAQKIGALASPSATTEELYLLGRLMRDMGSDNIDHRLRDLDLHRS